MSDSTQYIDNLTKAEIDSAICIEDFCGYTSPGHFPITFSADWIPSRRKTYFTGDWESVPPMPSDEEPTEEQVWAWAKKHGWKA